MMPYTNDPDQIRRSIIPAYERELAAAKAKGDTARVDSLETHLRNLQRAAGIEDKAMSQAPTLKARRVRAK